MAAAELDKLLVNVCEAQRLGLKPNIYYCEVKFDVDMKQTKQAPESLTPKWVEELAFAVKNTNPDGVLRIEVWRAGAFLRPATVVAHADLKLTTLFDTPARWFDLILDSPEKGAPPNGIIYLATRLPAVLTEKLRTRKLLAQGAQPPAPAPAPAATAPASAAAPGAAAPAAAAKAAPAGPTPPASKPVTPAVPGDSPALAGGGGSGAATPTAKGAPPVAPGAASPATAGAKGPPVPPGAATPGSAKSGPPPLAHAPSAGKITPPTPVGATGGGGVTALGLVPAPAPSTAPGSVSSSARAAPPSGKPTSPTAGRENPAFAVSGPTSSGGTTPNASVPLSAAAKPPAAVKEETDEEEDEDWGEDGGEGEEGEGEDGDGEGEDDGDYGTETSAYDIDTVASPINLTARQKSARDTHRSEQPSSRNSTAPAPAPTTTVTATTTTATPAAVTAVKRAGSSSSESRRSGRGSRSSTRAATAPAATSSAAARPAGTPPTITTSQPSSTSTRPPPASIPPRNPPVPPPAPPAPPRHPPPRPQPAQPPPSINTTSTPEPRSPNAGTRGGLDTIAEGPGGTGTGMKRTPSFTGRNAPSAAAQPPGGAASPSAQSTARSGDSGGRLPRTSPRPPPSNMPSRAPPGGALESARGWDESGRIRRTPRDELHKWGGSPRRTVAWDPSVTTPQKPEPTTSARYDAFSTDNDSTMELSNGLERSRSRTLDEQREGYERRRKRSQGTFSEGAWEEAQRVADAARRARAANVVDFNQSNASVSVSGRAAVTSHFPKRKDIFAMNDVDEQDVPPWDRPPPLDDFAVALYSSTAPAPSSSLASLPQPFTESSSSGHHHRGRSSRLTQVTGGDIMDDAVRDTRDVLLGRSAVRPLLSLGSDSSYSSAASSRLAAAASRATQQPFHSLDAREPTGLRGASSRSRFSAADTLLGDAPFGGRSRLL